VLTGNYNKIIKDILLFVAKKQRLVSVFKESMVHDDYLSLC